MGLLLFILATFASIAQTDSAAKPIRIIAATVTDLAADPFGNLYLVSASGQIKKLNENGDSAGVFNLARKYGSPTRVDASYPLKIMFYYQPYATLVITDRFFNLLNTIDLRTNNLFQVKAVAPAYDGQYWIYDEQETRLVKMNDQGNITLRTTPFRQLFDEPPYPEKIIDHNGLIYLYDPEKGIYVFDYFGTFKTHIPLLNWTDVHAFNKTIYGLHEGMLMRHTLDQPLTQTAPVPAQIKGIKKMAVTHNRLYLADSNNVYVFPVR
jgi:hypothetical protein